MAFKTGSPMEITLGHQYNVREKPNVILFVLVCVGRRTFCDSSIFRNSEFLSHLYSNKGRFKRSKFCFQISNFPKLWQSRRGILPNYCKNFGRYWALKSGAVNFQNFSPFQICVAPAHKGDVRASYAVPQVALNSRGSLDIGEATADRRKCGAPSAYSSTTGVP